MKQFVILERQQICAYYLKYIPLHKNACTSCKDTEVICTWQKLRDQQRSALQQRISC